MRFHICKTSIKASITEKLKLQAKLSDISRTVNAMEALISESIQPRNFRKRISSIKEDISIQQGELNAINREIIFHKSA